jgi:hypothetical protein
MAPGWLTAIAWLYLSVCFCCAGIIAYDIVLNHRRQPFPGSSPELKEARREHEGAAQRFSRDYPRVEGELGAAA